jgi:dTMP kinase
MCFPDRDSPVGKVINDYLHNSKELEDHVIHLLFAANRWEHARRIEDRLSRGISIVCDRYWYSGVAYSAAKGLDPKWCEAPDHGLPPADIVLYVDCEPEKLRSHDGLAVERYEKLEFQKRVRDCFEKLYDSVNWARIDGSGTVNEVTDAIHEVLKERLNLKFNGL